MGRGLVGAFALLLMVLVHATLAAETYPKKVKCKIYEYKQCYGLEHNCPANCPDCLVDCVACKPVCKCDQPGAVCQDPRFIGGDGLTFYFHGKNDRDFCLLSDSNLHINAHFIGKRSPNIKRDFTWVQSIGILFNDHQIFVGAQKTGAWDDSIDRLALAFDGEPISIPSEEGAKWQPTLAPIVSITRSRKPNSVVIEVEGNFKITASVVPITAEESKVHGYGITEEDCFAHLELGFKFHSLTDAVNGVLGQTYAKNYVSRVKMGVAMSVLGGDREFASSSLFTPDCAVSRFEGSVSSSSSDMEIGSINCRSGMGGRGVVCKR